MTPIQLQDTILHAVGEPEAIFHTRDLVRNYVQHGEQLLGMIRATTESLGSLNLNYNQGLYDLLSLPAFSGFVYPLHVTINRKELFPTTLSRVVDRDREWGKSIEMPREFFMLSSTHIGFYPTPPGSGLVARITFIRLPEVTPDSGILVTSPEWHEVIGEYVSAILLAKEQKYEVAALKLQAFIGSSGLERDVRFSMAEVKGDRATAPVHQITNVMEG